MPAALVPYAFGLFFAAIVALVIWGIVNGIKTARLRREALARLAADIGLTYTQGDDADNLGSVGQFSPFRIGTSRAAYNTLAGTTTIAARPCGIRMGDFRYVTKSGSGENRETTTHNFSYLYARVSFALTATWAIRKENIADRLVSAIGFEDINFESAEFSRKYHVKSSDKKFVYDLFDPRMIEWFMTSDPCSCEMIGRDLLLTTGGSWKPEEFRQHYDWLVAFLEHWPAHVIDALDASPAAQ